MIEVYSWATPSGHQVHIMLEECELPDQLHPVDIGSGQQFTSDFLAISPNNKAYAPCRQQGVNSSSLEALPSNPSGPIRISTNHFQ